MLGSFSYFLVLLYVFRTTRSLSVNLKQEQKVAVVTGGNKGIGKEIVRLFGKDPSITTILACRSLEKGQQAIEEIVKADKTIENIHCIEFDLTEPSSSAAGIFDYIESNHDGKLDILVNNGAICFNDPTLYGKVEHTPFERQADITVKTNFWGTWKLTQALTPLLNKCEEGGSSPRLINIASSAGRLAILRSEDLVKRVTSDILTMEELEEIMLDFVRAVSSGSHADAGWPNTCYGMSKLGIIAMTKVLARERPNWMCNTVDPGYCATDQNNNQGFRPAARGAVTPHLLATLPESQRYTGLHWFDEQTIEW